MVRGQRMKIKEAIKQLKRLDDNVDIINDKHLGELYHEDAMSYIIGEAKEIYEKFKYGCGDDITQNRAVAIEPDFCGEIGLCDGCEEIKEIWERINGN